MTIGFHSNQLCLRGTEVALFDYANHAEKLLGARSIIFTPRFAKNHAKETIERFQKRFEVVFYWPGFSLAREAKRRQVDAMYAIKGAVDSLNPGVPQWVHGVFDGCKPHGDRFAYISRWLSEYASGGIQPFVPHMIDLPKVEGDWRARLGIPSNATVVARHGGADTFDLPIAHRAVFRALEARDDLWFLFLNTDPFGPKHSRLIHAPGISDLDEKVRFLQTADAMLHAREGGETFGIAIGEFSVARRPVMTWSGSKERAHLEILGEKALVYESEDDLVKLLSQFDRSVTGDASWDRYSNEFGPAPVMEKFRRVFIEGEK